MTLDQGGGDSGTVLHAASVHAHQVQMFTSLVDHPTELICICYLYTYKYKSHSIGSRRPAQGLVDHPTELFCILNVYF